MRILKNKVFRNASWIIVCKIVQSVLGLLIGMLTARYLGPANYGIINYAASLVAFVVPIMQLGLTDIIVRDIVKNPEKEGAIIGTSITLSLFSSFLCVIAVLLFVLVANTGETVTIIVCSLYSLLLIAQSVEHITYWFQAKLLSKYTSIISLLAYVCVSAYRIYLLVSSKSIYWFALSQAFDFAFIAIFSIITYRKIGGQHLCFSKTLAVNMFSRSKYYIVSGLMVTIFAQTDKIMLKLMIGDTAIGYYSAAVTCAGMFSFVFAAIIYSARPLILECFDSDKAKFEKNMSRLYCVIIYFSLLQSICMTVFAQWIVHILYGEQYVASVQILMLIVWYTTFAYLGAVRNIWILAEEKQKYLWIINLSGASFNVILNLICIPILGAIGAALASLLTQIFTNVIIGYIIKPLRYNNKLMLRGLNPKYLLEYVK